MRKLESTAYLIALCFFALIAGGALALYWPALHAAQGELVFSPEMSIKELADANGVPGKEVLHGLSHTHPDAWDWPRTKPITNLPIPPSEVREAIEHVLEEAAPARDTLKYGLWGLWLLLSLWLLVSGRVNPRTRLAMLIGTVLIFGVALGATPNPMEGAVKVFKALGGLEAEPLRKAGLLALFLVMGIVGNKLICGWGCQFGALQDVIHNLSPLKKLKRWQARFWLANTIRIVILIVFVELLYGLVFARGNFVLYHQVNLFKLFNWDLAPVGLIALPVILVLSLVVYRPYCQFICLFGLVGWAVENLSIYKVRVSEDLCIHCDKCVRACPTQAMLARMHGARKSFLPDCWACGKCVEVCPTDAVVFDRKLPEPEAADAATDDE